MGKKGISIWIFSTLTVIALAHLIDATSALLLNNPTRLLPLYPYIGDKLQTVPTLIYFWSTTITTLILWGVTCAIAFSNPVEIFLNKILSDAKTQTAVEAQLLEQKSEILDLMNENIEADGKTLAQMKDLLFNVRTEVKEIPPLKDNLEKVRTEITSLKREIKKIEEKVQFPNICPACGKALLPEFKICPYCGATIKVPAVPAAPIIDLKDYK